MPVEENTMWLIEIRHYAGYCDIWHIPNMEREWSEEECRAYIDEENKKRKLARIHNEIRPTDYYVTDKDLPDWDDGKWYDYSQCPKREMSGSTCAEGCHTCPYEGSAHVLQLQQQITWFEKECTHFVTAED